MSAFVIVVGNEKGGAGKTTAAMHLIAVIMALGFKVTSVDTDVRQASLTKYIENRRRYAEEHSCSLKIPEHHTIHSADDVEALDALMEKVSHSCDFVVIDTPGSDTPLARRAHMHGSIVVTPINDSFVDLDLLVEVDHSATKVVRPGIYSQMVWEQKMERLKTRNLSMQWIVVRNRVSSVEARNKRKVTEIVSQIASRLGCKVSHGFGERVIFKELFPFGLTLLDIKNNSAGINFGASQILARHELFQLVHTLGIPALQNAMREVII